MAEFYITKENVCAVATTLVSSIDVYYIKSEIIEDAEDFIVELRVALDNFNHPFNDKNARDYCPTSLFNKHLVNLLNATKNFYNILSEEGKRLLEEHFLKQNKK